jgi:hypothetical protein
MNFHIQQSAVIVKPEGEPIYSERATIVRVDDEAGGPFVIVEQNGRADTGKIMIEPDEWPTLRKAIDQIMKLCEGKE